MSTNLYAKDFFALQLRFAEKAAELTGQPLTTCIQNYTAFSGSFGLGTSFDWQAPLWQRYISAIDTVDDPLEWTYQTYRTLQAELPAPTGHFWGCFSYNLQPEDTSVVRPHFANNDDSGLGALSSARKATRITELTAMFSDLRRDAPTARTVRGESWMYNRPAYTRLFPPEYIATARPIAAPFQFRGLWGQFVDSEGQVDAAIASTFLRSVAELRDTEGIERCFPYSVLRAEGAIDLFYRFYGLST